MTRGGKDMKILRIKDNSGEYIDAKGQYLSIDRIGKDGLLYLVNLTLENDAVEFDEYNEALIKNHAHRIIYKSIFEKLKSLEGRRQQFKDEAKRLYLKEFQKYRITPPATMDKPGSQNPSKPPSAPSEPAEEDIFGF